MRHAAGMEDIRNAFKILAGKPEDPNTDGKMLKAL
jgi:hypothetical protein